MQHRAKYTRPSFEDANTAWKALLSRRGFPTDLVWVFDENLCFEKDPSGVAGFKLGFQTSFTPPPSGAEGIAYEYFSDFDTRLVFYRIGSCRGRSLCLMLCDEWFETRKEGDGFKRRDDWLMLFYPGAQAEIEEIKDEQRWKNRVLRNRPLHDLDFCMTLRAVHESLAHGRVLSTYEHFALKLLHLWRQILRPSR